MTEIEETTDQSKRNLLIKIVIGALILLIADQVTRELEINTLISRVESSEEIINTFKADLYQLEDDGSKAFAAKDSEASDLATSARAGLVKTDAEIESTFVLPWHSSINTAKSDYDLHSNAWLSSMAAISIVDDGVIRSEEDFARINKSWEQSLKTMSEAIQFFDLSNVSERLQALEDN